MLLDDIDYHLPKAQIAQRPLERREDSRLLLVERETGHHRDAAFSHLPSLLQGDELLVFNNTRVIPARLLGRRASTTRSSDSAAPQPGHLTGTVEIFLTKQLDPSTWQALVRPGRKIRLGERILFGNGDLEAEITDRGELGSRTVRFTSRDGQDITHHINQLGHIPLPPYIDRADESSDRERYQTVFAKQPGAIAAPTAALHFTPEILQAIRARGAEICEITLHVGLGTFQPIHGDTLESHVMHSESYEISDATAQSIHAAHSSKRPILAIGTTVVRALEDAAARATNLSSAPIAAPGKAEASIFITPGFRFRIVDALLTNFHLPRSTLLALVCAFAGRQHTLAAYNHAVEAGYRFYSYGDCMLIR
ncbi:MAG TPA: tRNA preQ1(34) S-adenosylmethionine ribosyltransferase-isomerase QueA [Candidatus Acidoferrum sp.]|jgi:S-adenosylmethionine:tRNA ribosyltransferase-isomerase